jgi:hypothetical protein
MNNNINNLKNALTYVDRDDSKHIPKNSAEKLSDFLLFISRKAFGNIATLKEGTLTYPTSSTSVEKISRVVYAIVFIIGSPVLVPITFVGVVIATKSASRTAAFSIKKTEEFINNNKDILDNNKNNDEDEVISIEKDKENTTKVSLKNLLDNSTSEEIQKIAKESEVYYCHEGKTISLLLEVASKEQIPYIVKGCLEDEKNNIKKINKIIQIKDEEKINAAYETLPQEIFKKVLENLHDYELRAMIHDVPPKFISSFFEVLTTKEKKESNHPIILKKYLTDLFTDKKQFSKLTEILHFITKEMMEELIEDKKESVNFLSGIISIPKNDLPKGISDKCKEMICKSSLTCDYPIEILVSIATHVPNHPDLVTLLREMKGDHRYASAENYMKIFTALFDRSVDEFSPEDLELFLNEMQYNHTYNRLSYSFSSEKIIAEKLKTTAQERRDLLSKFFDKADFNTLSTHNILRILDIFSEYNIRSKQQLIAKMTPEKIQECLDEMFNREQSYIKNKNSKLELSKDLIERKIQMIQYYEKDLRSYRHSIDFLTHQLDFTNSKEEADKIQALIYGKLTKEQYEQVCDKIFRNQLLSNQKMNNHSPLFAFASQGLSEEKSAEFINVALATIKKNLFSNNNELALKNFLNEMKALTTTSKQISVLIEAMRKNSMDSEMKTLVNKTFDDNDTATLELLVQEWKPALLASYLDKSSFGEKSKHKGFIEVLKKLGKYEDTLKEIDPRSEIFLALTNDEQMMLLEHFIKNTDNYKKNHYGHGQLYYIFNNITGSYVTYNGLNKNKSNTLRKDLTRYLQFIAGISNKGFVDAFSGIVASYNNSIQYKENLENLSEAKNNFEPAITDLLELMKELDKNCQEAINNDLIPSIVENILLMGDKEFYKMQDVYKSSETEIVLALKLHSWKGESAELWKGEKLAIFLNQLTRLALPLTFDYMSDSQKTAVKISLNLKKHENNHVINLLKTMKSNLESKALVKLILNNWDELSKAPNFSNELNPFLIVLTSEGEVDSLREFHKKGVNLKFQSEEGLSLLHIAAAHQQQEMINFLIQEVDVDKDLMNLKTNKESYPKLENFFSMIPRLKISKDLDYKDYTELLLKHAAPYYAKDWLERGYTEEKAIKFLSPKFKQFKITSFENCLDHISDKNRKFKNGDTLFHIAMENIDSIPSDILQKLVKHGSDVFRGKGVNPDVKNNKGETPIQLANKKIEELENSTQVLIKTCESDVISLENDLNNNKKLKSTVELIKESETKLEQKKEELEKNRVVLKKIEELKNWVKSYRYKTTPMIYNKPKNTSIDNRFNVEKGDMGNIKFKF